MNSTEHLCNHKVRVARLLDQLPSKYRGVASPALASDVRESMPDGSVLPGEVKEWLELCNGCYTVVGHIGGLGAGCRGFDISAILKLYPTWIGKEWVPVGDDGCGDFYVLQTKSGEDGLRPVYFVDQMDMDAADYVVASGLWPFLAFALEQGVRRHDMPDFYWPFDKEQVLARDPALKEYRGPVPLPWDA